VSGTVYDMYFVNANTGWVTLYSPFNTLKTTDGGQSWTVQLSGNTLRAGVLQFFNDTAGVSLGSNSSNLSTILQTTNGGVNWTAIHVSSGDIYRDISFISKDTGWVCGDNGNSMLRIWRTTDGGVSFQEQYNTGGGSFTHIFMLKEKVNGVYWGWAYVGALYRTTNSGLNWNQISTISGTCGLVRDMVFVDDLNGAVVMDDCIGKTTSSGLNWTYNNEPYLSSGSTVAMGSDSVGWISIATDSIIKTINFFQTYGKQLIPAYASKVFASDTSVVYGGANEVNMIKTTNGGGPIIYLGIDSNSTIVPTAFTLFQNYPNPFNPITTINFSLSRSGYVTLTIYDATGKELFKAEKDKYYSAGNYYIRLEEMWRMASGLYLYKLSVTDENSRELYEDTKKMLLVK
jgi:hypothetical protein